MTGSLGDIKIAIKSPLHYIDLIASVAAVYFFYCEFGMHNFYHGISSIPPIHGIYALTAYIAFRIVVEPQLLASYFNKGLSLWLLFAIFMLGVNYLVSKILYGHQYENHIDDIASLNLTSYILLFDFIILFAMQGVLKLLKWLLPLALIFAVANNIYDITLFEEDYGYGFDFRAAGNYLNPNASAQILLMGLLLTIKLVAPGFRFLYVLVLSVGIFSTLSRGAAPMLVLVLFYFIASRKFSIKSVLLGLTGIVIISASLYNAFRETPSFDRMVEYLKYNNGIEGRLNQIIDPSSAKIGIRQTVFEEHFQFYKNSPVIGNGLGSSKHFETHYSGSGHSSHFMYLHMLNEYGITGILLILLVPVSFFYRRSKWFWDWDVFIFSLLFLLSGLQSHNLLDSYSMLFSYAFLVSLKAEIPVLKT